MHFLGGWGSFSLKLGRIQNFSRGFGEEETQFVRFDRGLYQIFIYGWIYCYLIRRVVYINIFQPFLTLFFWVGGKKLNFSNCGGRHLDKMTFGGESLTIWQIWGQYGSNRQKMQGVRIFRWNAAGSACPPPLEMFLKYSLTLSIQNTSIKSGNNNFSKYCLNNKIFLCFGSHKIKNTQTNVQLHLTHSLLNTLKVKTRLLVYYLQSDSQCMN